MKKNLLQNNKIFISAILLIILSTLNYYNLKDKAFIKLEKYIVEIKNELLAQDFGSRIKLKNLNVTNLKLASDKFMRNDIKIDSTNTFYLITSWSSSEQDDLIKKMKVQIYNEYFDSFKEEKKNIQNQFLLFYDLYITNTNGLNNIKLDEAKIDKVSYLMKLNKNFTELKFLTTKEFLINKTQLDLINEIENTDFNFVSILKTFEKREYLIFFAMVFNQLIIFIIVFFSTGAYLIALKYFKNFLKKFINYL